MKHCKKCDKSKDSSAFRVLNSAKSKLYSYCKSCEKEYYDKNKDRLLAQKKAYYSKNKPVILKKVKEYQQLTKKGTR
jgi:hypothetical protein